MGVELLVDNDSGTGGVRRLHYIALLCTFGFV